MNHLFVPYQEVLEFKNLGFNEPCLATYEFKKLFIGEFKNSMSFELCKKTEVFPAPTWDQAFTWFREKHDLYGSVSNLPDKKMLFFPLIWDAKELVWINPHSNTKSYEECQIILLQQLIEIVKSKVNQ